MNAWFRSTILLSLSFFCTFHTYADDLSLMRTPSTGYQVQFQVVGNRIYYTWNESDEKFRQIWMAEMNIGGTGWRATQRTTTPFDKYEPQLQVVGERVYLVWR